MADPSGGASGLLVRGYKGKEADRLVTRSAPGVVSLHSDLRAHERQAAEKLGQWKTERSAGNLPSNPRHPIYCAYAICGGGGRIANSARTSTVMASRRSRQTPPTQPSRLNPILTIPAPYPWYWQLKSFDWIVDLKRKLLCFSCSLASSLCSSS